MRWFHSIVYSQYRYLPYSLLSSCTICAFFTANRAQHGIFRGLWFKKRTFHALGMSPSWRPQPIALRLGFEDITDSHLHFVELRNRSYELVLEDFMAGEDLCGQCMHTRNWEQTCDEPPYQSFPRAKMSGAHRSAESWQDRHGSGSGSQKAVESCALSIVRSECALFPCGPLPPLFLVTWAGSHDILL
jgi:hypothetical protein